MEQPRRPTPRSNPRSKSAGTASRTAASASRAAASASRAANSTSRSVGSTSGLSKDVQMNESNEEHEVEVVYKGLPCPCKNCGITFGSYLEYYSHLVYSPAHAPQPPLQPPVDLELKLAAHGQPNIDLELRLRPPTNQKN